MVKHRICCNATYFRNFSLDSLETMVQFYIKNISFQHLTLIICIFQATTVRNDDASANQIAVLVNNTAFIHCYTNASIDIQWHFNSIYTLVYAGNRLTYPYKDRFRMENNRVGMYTLIITEVKNEDAGWYYCSEETSTRRFSSTRLTVLYAGIGCYLNMHPAGFIGPNTCNLEQENMVFNCVVSFNGEPPHLIWRSLNDSKPLNTTVCKDQPNRRNCSMTLKPHPSYDGSIFICQLVSSNGIASNCSTEVIKILYFLDFTSINDTAKKYVNDNVNCSANSNRIVKYNWTLQQNNKVAFLSTNQSLEIQTPGIYQCEVNYSIRNYSCLSISSVINVSFESNNGVIIRGLSTESTNGGTTSGTTSLVIKLSIGFMFVVLSTGMIILICKCRKRKRENRRKEYNKSENERIRNKIEGMYKEFVLEVDPENVLEPLIQKNIISNEVKSNMLNKETTEDKCRFLLDRLYSCPEEGEAFIVLKEALSPNYPDIVERINAIDKSLVTTIPKNERIKDKVISMYIDFTSEVDPKNIFDLLIQSRIFNVKEKKTVMNKDTAKERCRALIDHLYFCSKENAFIILREALRDPYPRIVDRIDASGADNEAKDETATGKEENERIRNRVVDIYEEFVSEVDPEKVLDFLIQNKIVNLKQRYYLKNQVTKDDQCKALLDLLFSCSKENAFIILKEALKEHYSEIVKHIDSLTTDDEDQNNSDKRSKMSLESSIIVFGRDAFKINLNRPDEVSDVQQLPVVMSHFMTAAVYCGWVFLTGIGEYRKEIWRFDARCSKWQKCASLMKGRLGSSVAFVDHILYICGGIKGLDDVEAYDALDDKCSVVGKLSYAVYGAGNCVPYKASLYIFGGLNAQNEDTNCVQVYNTKFNTCTILTNPMPRNAAYLHAALFTNYVILLGEKSCFLYNFDTETWEVRDKFKTEIDNFGMTVHSENLILIGGIDPKGIYRDDVRYVPIVNILNDEPIEWKVHSKLPKLFAVVALAKLEMLVKQI